MLFNTLWNLNSKLFVINSHPTRPLKITFKLGDINNIKMLESKSFIYIRTLSLYIK